MPSVISKQQVAVQKPQAIMLSMQSIIENELVISSQNIASSGQNGFKKYIFRPEEVIYKTKDNKKLSYVKPAGTIRDLSDGALNVTQNPLDVAITGKGYFMVQTPQGLRYTRDGKFSKDQFGRLTAQGYPVLNAGGSEIVLPSNINKFEVANDGSLVINGKAEGKIAVIIHPNEHALRAEGQGLFSAPTEGQQATQFQITQGALEQSNVSPMEESIRLMEMLRRYESSQKVSDQYDELQKKVLNVSARNA